MKKFRLDHIGYITKDISETSKAFELLGYSPDEIVNDDTQQTRICFLRKEGETNIELVEPYEDNEPMLKMLSKRGPSPYHVCYEVDDIETSYEEMIDNDFMPLFKPVEAPAFGNRKICYFSKLPIGLIEIVNK